MLKKSLLIAISTMCFFTAQAQQAAVVDTIKDWKTGGMFSLAFSQTTLSNWAAGGENSLSGNALVNLFAIYKKDRREWETTLNLGYGLLQQQSDGTRKTDDKIDLSSKFGYQASKNWYYTAMVNFKTQFTEGFNYPNDSVRISNFMAPAYLTTALGMDYKPNDKLSVFISPATGKTTFVLDKSLSDAGAFGVDPGKQTRYELGGFFTVKYTDQDIIKNIGLATKIELFSNYLDKPQNIDVNWELLITAKINKFISAILSTQLIYDDDIRIGVTPYLQFKEVFGLGLSYKF